MEYFFYSEIFLSVVTEKNHRCLIRSKDKFYDFLVKSMDIAFFLFFDEVSYFLDTFISVVMCFVLCIVFESNYLSCCICLFDFITVKKLLVKRMEKF